MESNYQQLVEFISENSGVSVEDTNENVLGSAQTPDDFTQFLLFIDVEANGTATNRTIQFKVQYSQDGGTTFYDYRNGFWANLVFEDGEVANSTKRCYHGKCVGQDWRVVEQASGTLSATDNFVVSVDVEFIRK